MVGGLDALSCSPSCTAVADLKGGVVLMAYVG